MCRRFACSWIRIHTLSPPGTLLVALRRLINEGVTDAPVINSDGRVIGMLSEYDRVNILVKGRDADMPHGPVSEFMNSSFTAVSSMMDVHVWGKTGSDERSPSLITLG